MPGCSSFARALPASLALSSIISQPAITCVMCQSHVFRRIVNRATHYWLGGTLTTNWFPWQLPWLHDKPGVEGSSGQLAEWQPCKPSFTGLLGSVVPGGSAELRLGTLASGDPRLGTGGSGDLWLGSGPAWLGHPQLGSGRGGAGVPTEPRQPGERGGPGEVGPPRAASGARGEKDSGLRSGAWGQGGSRLGSRAGMPRLGSAWPRAERRLSHRADGWPVCTPPRHRRTPGLLGKGTGWEDRTRAWRTGLLPAHTDSRRQACRGLLVSWAVERGYVTVETNFSMSKRSLVASFDRAYATSADAREVAKFAAMAQTWWDVDGPFAPLHRMNPTRIAFIRSALCHHFSRDPQTACPLQGLSMLDVGCGGGLLTEALARLGATVKGIDASPESVAIAHLHSARDPLTGSIEYSVSTAEQLVSSGCTFDVVTALEVIEHVPDVPAFTQSLASLCRPGGALFISTINRTLRSYALAIGVAEYLLRWVPRGTHNFARFVTPEEVALVLARSGLVMEEIAGIVYDPLTGAWDLAEDTGVNYIVYVRKKDPGTAGDAEIDGKVVEEVCDEKDSTAPADDSSGTVRKTGDSS